MYPQAQRQAKTIMNYGLLLIDVAKLHISAERMRISTLLVYILRRGLFASNTVMEGLLSLKKKTFIDDGLERCVFCVDEISSFSLMDRRCSPFMKIA
jgi:hypothetical protein